MGDQQFVEGQLEIMYKFDQKSGIAGAGVEAGMGAVSRKILFTSRIRRIPKLD